MLTKWFISCLTFFHFYIAVFLVVVNQIPADSEVYFIHLWFPPPIKLTATI